MRLYNYIIVEIQHKIAHKITVNSCKYESNKVN